MTQERRYGNWVFNMGPKTQNDDFLENGSNDYD
jgi:hypothetical protein